MAESSEERDLLDVLAEEFVARFRAGERPSLTEYADRLPDRADEVRELFPALVEMEQLKPVAADHTGDYRAAPGPTDPLRVGEFRILRRVGFGGMGVVYEAVQESLGRHVALKLLPAEAVADPRSLERFRREARAAARLHHTNIVPVFGTSLIGALLRRGGRAAARGPKGPPASSRGGRTPPAGRGGGPLPRRSP